MFKQKKLFRLGLVCSQHVEGKRRHKQEYLNWPVLHFASPRMLYSHASYIKAKFNQFNSELTAPETLKGIYRTALMHPTGVVLNY